MDEKPGTFFELNSTKVKRREYFFFLEKYLNCKYQQIWVIANGWMAELKLFKSVEIVCGQYQIDFCAIFIRSLSGLIFMICK